MLRQLYLVWIKVQTQLLLHKLLILFPPTAGLRHMSLNLIRWCGLTALGQPFLHYKSALFPSLYRLVWIISWISSILLLHRDTNCAEGTLWVHFPISWLLTVWGWLLVARAWTTHAHWGLEGVQIDLLRLSLRLESCSRYSIWVKTLTYWLLKSWGWRLSCLSYYLLGFFLLGVYRVSFLPCH